MRMNEFGGGARSKTIDANALVDSFGRKVTYLRVSLTDRCDLRCTYCMSEKMTFLPRSEVLSFEEMERMCRVFVGMGVRKIRLTGGEPLVRRGAVGFVKRLSTMLGDGLDELTLTTNGTLLARCVDDLVDAGVTRVNVSLDTLDGGRYRQITRNGSIQNVLAGIDAALSAGLKVKLNAVASKGPFEEEVDRLIRFAHGQGMDLTLIEEMPLGLGQSRTDTYLPLSQLRTALEKRWTLIPVKDSTGGPARYVRIAETDGRLGFITPMSCSFCTACNRVRVDCTGRLFTCMGQEGSVDLRPLLRSENGMTELRETIRTAIRHKAKGHNFSIGSNSVSGITRTMSVLGG